SMLPLVIFAAGRLKGRMREPPLYCPNRHRREWLRLGPRSLLGAYYHSRQSHWRLQLFPARLRNGTLWPAADGLRERRRRERQEPAGLQGGDSAAATRSA